MTQIDFILSIETKEQFELYRLLEKYGNSMTNSNRLKLLKEYLPTGETIAKEVLINECRNHKFVSAKEFNEKMLDLSR